MSVLIKGMGMPQNCDECSFTKMESEFHGICTAIRNDVCYVYPDKGKPEWCPLVEVPTPHGRLIDENQLRAIFAYEPSIDITDREKILKLMAEMPTVIEAEE